MDRSQLQIELLRNLSSKNVNLEGAFGIFHDRWLSPVRDQTPLGTCTFVSCVACIEMLYRVRTHEDHGFYPAMEYFDVNELFDNIFDCSDDGHQILDSTGWSFGGTIPVILSYVVNHGLISDTECRNPRTRNLRSFYCKEVPRTRILSYKEIDLVDVFAVASHTPMIVTVFFYSSFGNCREIFYCGPSEEELILAHHPTNPCFPYKHALIVVGNWTLRFQEGTQRFLILQNSYGESFGFRGFILVPLSVPTFFVDFWLVEGIDRTDFTQQRDLEDYQGGALEDVEMQICNYFPNPKA